MIPSIGVDVLVSLADQITAPLRDVESTISKASDRMNDRLKLSMKLAGAGAVAGVVAAGARRMVTGFTDSIREVERAKGELATLGVRDLEVVTRRAREMQMQLAGVTADAFVRASYDIKSGISSLTDEGVADMTAAAMWTAKATRGIPEQMTSLFATSYGIFKDQYAIMSDADFGNMFGAALSASVQQFKTDGAAMQQAIESAGAGAVNLGMEMTEQLALLGMMQQTMQAGEAGTALRAFATNAAKAHAGFAELATDSANPIVVRILDEGGRLRAMPDILSDLKTRYGETLDAFEAAEIKEAFGTDEAMKMINALYGQEAAVRANAQALEDAAAQGADFTEQMARAADNNWDATMVLMAQRMNVLQQMIGERLLPVVQRLIPYIDAFITKAFDWIDANPELITGIGMVVVGLGAFLAVAAPILLATSSMVAGWATISYAATRLGITLLSLPRGLLALLNPMKLIRGALFALRFALISTGIGAIVVGIAMAGAWIYKNWSGLKAFFQGFGKAFMAALGPVGPVISNIAGAIGDLISWIGNLFGPLDASAAQWQAWGENAGRVVGDMVAKIDDIFRAITSFDWSSLLTLDGLRAAWAGIVRFVADAGARIWDAIIGVEWSKYLPLDALASAWAAVTGFLGRVLGSIWNALSPLSWLGIIKSDDLAGAWATVTGLLAGFSWAAFINPLSWASWVSEKLDLKAWVDGFAWTDLIDPFGWGAWVSDRLDLASWVEGFAWSAFIAPFAWGAWVSDRIDLASWVEGFAWSAFIAPFAWGAWVSDRIDLASWVEGFAWSAFIAPFAWGAWVSDRLDLASWVEGFAWAAFIAPFAWGAWVSDRLDLAAWIEDFSWSDVIGTLPIANWLQFSWADVLPAWDWSSVIPDLPDLKSLFSDAGETIDVRLESRATAGIGEWDRGLALVDEYRQGLVDLGDVQAELAAKVATEEGQWNWSNDVERAAEMLSLLEQINAASTASSPRIENPESLLEAAQAANQLETQLPAISAAAAEALAAVRSVLAGMMDAIRSVDMTSEGARITQSIANGMLSQVASVRAAANQIAATIRNALPGNASVNVALAAVPNAPVQARAAGGAFGRGWLLTGEEGPELEYRNEGGFIAHNRALKGMVALASRARELAQDIGFGGGYDAAPVPVMANVASAGGAGSRGQAISFAPQFNMPLSFAPGVDMAEVRATVRAEMMDAEERSQVAMRSVLHDS